MAKSKVATTTRATRSSKKKEEVEPEEEVESSDDEDAVEEEENDESEQEDEQESVEEGSGDNTDDGEEDDEEEEEDDDEEEDNVNALFKGYVDDDEEQLDDDDASDGEGRNKPQTTTTLKGGPEQCNFDLRNMTAMNSHQILPSALYTKAPRKEELSICIPLEDGGLHVNEDFLLERSSAGCAQLIAAIWQLPTEMSDVGPLATLPGYDEIPIPRAMVRQKCYADLAFAVRLICGYGI